MATEEQNYPLYPRLTNEGEDEAQEMMKRFKRQLQAVIQQILSEVYIDLVPYIESDAWINFRNELMAGFRNYNNRKIQAEYDFAAIRQAIFEEYRDEIIADLNQDMIREIEDLKKQLEREREYSRQRY